MANNLQLYFYDNAKELKNCSDKLNESTVKELMDILKGNPYSIFLRSLTDMPNLQNFHIALKCDAGLDQRVYNVPTTTEIAAIWVDKNDGPATHAPHLQIYTHSNSTPCYFHMAKIRNDDEDEILHTGRLLQQYSVDEYIILETQRLDFVLFNQYLFKMGILQGLLDILRLGERDASIVGKQKFLPNSFIGGPRDMQQCYMDVIALVQRFGKLDLFITMTSKAYDDIIRAELPDDKAEPDLYKLIIKHMMHGPCGSLDPTNSCMKKKKGYNKFKYPKLFTDQTLKGNDSYLVYRRRNTGEVVKVREQYLDNSWVVPYNPYLLGKFNGHINIEVCSDIKVMKYLYKYICKGHDKITFCIQNNDTNIDIDEVKEYRYARWVSPPEAVWCLFGFPISEMSPSVYRLQLHLEGQQFISFKSNTDIQTILNNPMIQEKC
ncbi:uncharacterized protein [Nicotiana sylvestris]|uniref:uncharacterized protein n=1 Tax=Nicotiana sylvestris TaxID=4096 RepID=UPI00388CDBBE